MPSHAHNHHAGHSHDDGSSHRHAPRSFGAALAIGTFLNLGFVGVEFVFGLVSNSMALIADAGHNLADVLGLLAAWFATVLAQRAPCEIYTYGKRRGTILAALGNAGLLVLTVGAIGVEAVRRLFEPAPVAGKVVIVVASIGIAVNGLTAWLIAAGRDSDMNSRAAFLHMAYDALLSLAVVVAGVLILLSGWTWIDPLISLILAVFILAGTRELLRDSVAMALDAVPAQVKLAQVDAFLRAQPGVTSIHDLHVWSMSTTETALTCHCVMAPGHPGDDYLVELAHELKQHFGIAHATIQVEVDEHVHCALESHDAF